MALGKQAKTSVIVRFAPYSLNSKPDATRSEIG
jgi:hypothetical protein